MLCGDSASARWASSRRCPATPSPTGSGATACARWRLIRGDEAPLRPRASREGLSARLELPEGVSGPQLERALSLLVDRLLADPARRGRSLRRVRLGARLAGGGGWRAESTLREASVSPQRLSLALAPKLSELPVPLSPSSCGCSPPDRRRATSSR